MQYKTPYPKTAGRCIHPSMLDYNPFLRALSLAPTLTGSRSLHLMLDPIRLASEPCDGSRRDRHCGPQSYKCFQSGIVRVNVHGEPKLHSLTRHHRRQNLLYISLQEPLLSRTTIGSRKLRVPSAPLYTSSIPPDQ